MITQTSNSYSDQSYKLYADILIEMAREAWGKLDQTHRGIVFGCSHMGPNAVPQYPCGIKSYADPKKNCSLSLPELIIEAYGMQVMQDRKDACGGRPNMFKHDCVTEYFRHAAKEYNGNPNVISIDTARSLHSFYDVTQPQRLLLLNRCTRGIGNRVSTDAFHYLLENQDENQFSQVRLLFASQGSGKSTVIHQLDREDKKSGMHAITFDGVYEDLESMKKMIDAALEHGLPVSIVYVHTPAIEAASRAITRTLEDGRPIRLSQILKRNTQFRKQLVDLYNAYQGETQINFDLWLNGGTKGPARYSDFRKRLSSCVLSKDQEFQEYIHVTGICKKQPKEKTPEEIEKEAQEQAKKEAAEIEAILGKRAEVAFGVEDKVGLRENRNLHGIYLKPKDTRDFSQNFIPLSQIIVDQLRDPDPSWQKLREEVESQGDFFTLLEKRDAAPPTALQKLMDNKGRQLEVANAR